MDVLSELEFLEQCGYKPDIPRTDTGVIELAEKLFPLLWKTALEAEAQAGEVEAKCGTSLAMALFAALQNPAISDSTRAQVDSMIDAARPTLTKTYTSGHSTSG